MKNKSYHKLIRQIILMLTFFINNNITGQTDKTKEIIYSDNDKRYDFCLYKSTTINYSNSSQINYYNVNLGFKDYPLIIEKTNTDFIIYDLDENILSHYDFTSLNSSTNLVLQIGVYDFNNDGLDELLISFGIAGEKGHIDIYQYSTIDNKFHKFHTVKLLPCHHDYLVKLGNNIIDIPYGFNEQKYKTHNIIPPIEYSQTISLEWNLIDDFLWDEYHDKLYGDVNISFSEAKEYNGEKIGDTKSFSVSTYKTAYEAEPAMASFQLNEFYYDSSEIFNSPWDGCEDFVNNLRHSSVYDVFIKEVHLTTIDYFEKQGYPLDRIKPHAVCTDDYYSLSIDSSNFCGDSYWALLSITDINYEITSNHYETKTNAPQIKSYPLNNKTSDLSFHYSDSTYSISSIAVIPKHLNYCNGTSESAEQLASYIENNILDYYNVTDRRHLETILDEHRLQMSGLTFEKTLLESGCIENAQAYLFIQSGCLMGDDMIEIRLVHCESSTLIWSCTGLNSSPQKITTFLNNELQTITKED